MKSFTNILNESETFKKKTDCGTMLIMVYKNGMETAEIYFAGVSFRNLKDSNLNVSFKLSTSVKCNQVIIE